MKNNTIILIGLVLLVSSVFLDQNLAHSIVDYQNKITTDIMSVIAILGSGLAVTIITTALFLYDKKKRQYIPVLWLTLLLALAIAFILKYVIARPRPNISPLEIKNSFSFPSGHAAAVFAPLALIDKEFPKLKWFWLSFAVLVLVSRLYLGMHYLSDVIAGSLIGYITGLLVLVVTKHI